MKSVSKSNAEILPLLEIRIRRIGKAVEHLNPDAPQYDELNLRLFQCLADAIELYCSLLSSQR
jgi:hypothetical protein